MHNKNYFTYITLSLFGGASYYLSGIYGLLEFILSICIYTLIFYFLHYIWIKIRKRQIMYFNDFLYYFLKRISIFLLVITGIIGGGSYLLNEFFPAPMPEYTISNGEKTVKFQAMVHIGKQSFYDNIIKNLKDFKENGGVYFYEGVRPGSEKNLEKFNQAMGINFNDDLYANFSKLYGVTNQDNREFLGLVNDKDFNVDLSMDEIVEAYEQIINNKQNPNDIYQSKLPIDADKTILDTLAGLNDKQLKVLVYINQAILNFIIGSDSTQGFLTQNFANKDLFDVILGKRNQVLADAIINSQYEKIYITYGLLHFKGVLELLQKNDPKWQIITTRNFYPIKD